MTDNEIIKAWECCVIKCSCVGCPYKKDWQSFSSQCIDMRLEDTFDLITRQKAEIERLEKELENERGLTLGRQSRNLALKAEIERLRDALIDNEYANCVAVKNGLIYTHTPDDYDKLIGNISAEAIKEFAEKLCEDRLSNDPVVIAVKCELKEMVGDV